MSSRRRLGMLAALLGTATLPAGAWAQREIVQPLPPAGEADLSSALTRLAANPTNVDALLDAGEAALKLGDVDAATGFFGRASQLAPGNARIKLGLARAYVRSRRPIEALRLFAEAEQAGVSTAVMAEERGLAFDLVGDAASAQQLYRQALANGAGAETRRRLALSQAISGDRKGFEATLLPLLQNKDVAAFRTRAFGLAVLGDAKEAKSIANTMLPQGMGARMAAYLDYMPRLTQAQQAAAGNMGVFPRTVDIGTDNAQIAAYAGSGLRPVQASRTELPPRNPAVSAAPPVAAKPPAQARTSAPAPREKRESGSTRHGTLLDRRLGRTETVTRVVSMPAPASSAPSTPAPAPPPPPPPPSAKPPAPVPSIASTVRPPASAPPSKSAVLVASAVPQPQNSIIGSPVAATAQPQPAPVQSSPASPVPAQITPPPQEDLSLADAFASFTLPSSTPSPAAAGAVDITQIAIPREKEVVKPPPPPPPPPAHPARHWVQVATGKDTKALGFDWRRISRKAAGLLDGKGPFVTPWVEANRLLAGPYDSAASAKEMVSKLKGLGIDSFTFDSAAGEAIDRLK